MSGVEHVFIHEESIDYNKFEEPKKPVSLFKRFLSRFVGGGPSVK
jgi:hypothetical protein